MVLRLFRAETTGEVSAQSTLSDFFEFWYVPSLLNATERRPVANATIVKRRDSVRWWGRLMATTRDSAGPPIFAITPVHLKEFADKLRVATYRRGQGRDSAVRNLSPVTCRRHVEEIELILMAAGPKSRRRVRCGLIDEPPTIYQDEGSQFPKPTWTLDEARRIANAAVQCAAPSRWKLSGEAWRCLVRATLCLWFFTGHRASTYRLTAWGRLCEASPGEWFLDLPAAVKSHKCDRIALHPQLLGAIEGCRGIDDRQIIAWPIGYRTLFDHHAHWQKVAGLPLSRIFSPQAWRRLHATECGNTGFEMARSMASASLQHHSVDITEAHYSAIRNAARLRLPSLFLSQKLLF